jgi:omega-amidase
MTAHVNHPLRVALGEYDTGWEDAPTSLARARAVIEQSAAGDADIVVLPEMCTTGFTMNSAEYAEPLTGPSVLALDDMARRAGVHVLAGVATVDTIGDRCAYFNSALLFGPGGGIVAEYRKQRLFDYADEGESYSGGVAPIAVTIGGVRIALFICFDLRFPELFRRVAPEVDAIILIANWPASRREHWDVLTRARAIENQCYVVAVNRTGDGGGLAYDGGSAAYDPWGTALERRRVGGGLDVVDIDPGEVTRVRSDYPFVQDRRGQLLPTP